MPKTERRTFLLDFEKPLSELESRIHQIRDLAAENNVDVSEQIQQLEARADQLREEIFSTLTRPNGCNWHGIPGVPAPLIMFK